MTTVLYLLVASWYRIAFVGIGGWLLFVNQVRAQSPTAIPDSLARYLKTAPPDTTYIRVANDYVWWLLNPLDQLVRADSLLRRTEAVAKRLNDPMSLQRVYSNYGRLRMRQGDRSQPRVYFWKAYQIVRKADLPPVEWQRTLSQLGVVYYYAGQFETALNYFLKAISLTEQYGLHDYVTRAYVGASEVMSVMGRSPQALVYARKATEVAYQDQDRVMVLWAENALSDILSNQGRHQEALVHLKKALPYANRYGSRDFQSSTWSKMSVNFMRLNQYADALVFLKKAQQAAQHAGSLPGIKTDTHYLLGSYYRHIGQARRAERHFQRYRQISHQNKDILSEKEAVEYLAQLYGQTHQYAKAYRYQLQLAQLKDSLFSNQTALKLRALETQHETDKREARIHLLHEQHQRTLLLHNALLIGSLLLTALVIAVGAWLLNRARLRRLEEAQRIRQQLAHDLHDEMGSTLSSISLLSSMSNDLLKQPSSPAENPELVQRMVAKIYDDTRQMQQTVNELIWMVRPGDDSLAQIAARIRAYADPLFVSQGIAFLFVFEPRLEQQVVSLEVRRNLYLLGKEAINNVVKHAQATLVTLRFAYQPDNRSGPITVLIEDNGRGFDPAAPTARTGLQSIQQRTSAMGGSLAIRSAPGQGTSLLLTLLV